MVDVTLYVEGGGDSGALRSRCREGFRTFLEKAGFRGCMPRIVACGGRQSAFDMFRTACESHRTAVLLIDSEDCVEGTSSWEHLARRPGDGFVAPKNAAGMGRINRILTTMLLRPSRAPNNTPEQASKTATPARPPINIST